MVDKRDNNIKAVMVGTNHCTTICRWLMVSLVSVHDRHGCKIFFCMCLPKVDAAIELAWSAKLSNCGHVFGCIVHLHTHMHTQICKRSRNSMLLDEFNIGRGWFSSKFTLTNTMAFGGSIESNCSTVNMLAVSKTMAVSMTCGHSASTYQNKNQWEANYLWSDKHMCRE